MIYPKESADKSSMYLDRERHQRTVVAYTARVTSIFIVSLVLCLFPILYAALSVRIYNHAILALLPILVLLL
jgi:uncharacterized membrane protein